MSTTRDAHAHSPRRRGDSLRVRLSHPLLLLAPGGVGEIAAWERSAFNPIERFSSDFMVIAMDQRYAGRSRAPLMPFSYEQTLGDQIAVLNA